MANPEHLKILKQGVEAWNRWREENAETRPDLANLRESQLRGVSVPGTIQVGAKLRKANFQNADLYEACLKRADLAQTDLRGANLQGADLSHSRLRGADLQYAKLREASLRGSDLWRADLWSADLEASDLRKATLDGTNFGRATLAWTELSDVDLSVAGGLEAVRHRGPSEISASTLQRSQGKIPEEFLRGCGLTAWEIVAAKLHEPGLSQRVIIDLTDEIARLRGESPILDIRIFISYSHADTDFVEALESQLERRHCRYWRDSHDLMAGRLERQISHAMRVNPAVLLVLSERSVKSDWVEWEVTKAREIEKEQKRDVLCPVALDDAWKTCSWEGPLRRQVEKYNILDFSKWQDPETFSRQFRKLIDGLGLFYPKASGE